MENEKERGEIADWLLAWANKQGHVSPRVPIFTRLDLVAFSSYIRSGLWKEVNNERNG